MGWCLPLRTYYWGPLFCLGSFSQATLAFNYNRKRQRYTRCSLKSESHQKVHKKIYINIITGWVWLKCCSSLFFFFLHVIFFIIDNKFFIAYTIYAFVHCLLQNNCLDDNVITNSENFDMVNNKVMVANLNYWSILYRQNSNS